MLFFLVLSASAVIFPTEVILDSFGETDTVFSMLAFSLDCSLKLLGSRKDVFSSSVMLFLLKVNEDMTFQMITHTNYLLHNVGEEWIVLTKGFADHPKN